MRPGWGDTADYFCESDNKYRLTELKFLAVVQQLEMEDDAASSVEMIFGEPIETLDSIPTKSPMPHITSRQGRSHIRLGSRKPQKHKRIPSLLRVPEPDSSSIQKSKPVEPLSFHRCIELPKPITLQKLDLDRMMVTGPAAPEEWVGKLLLLMMYLLKMKFVYLFC